MNGSCAPGYTPDPSACVLGDASKCIKPKVLNEAIIVPVTLESGATSIRVNWVDLSYGFARFSWRKRQENQTFPVVDNSTRASSGLISGTTGYYDIIGLDTDTIYEISYQFEDNIFKSPIRVVSGITVDGWTDDMTEVIHEGNLVYHNSALVIL